MLRFLAVGLVSLSFSTAMAQTPTDIARQLWPQGHAVTSETAAPDAFPTTQFLPADIAHRPVSTRFFTGRAPAVTVSNAFTAAGLARLRGNDAPGLWAPPARDVRVAAEDHK